MTCDELALLRAVLENPADDLPRLVYADWLEEHPTGPCRECGATGQIRPAFEWLRCPTCSGSGRVSNSNRERAEFVRVQVELASVERRLADLLDDDTDWEQCTELSARWCPNCGDCSCRTPEESLSDADCPLHSPNSDHCCKAELEEKQDALRRRERELKPLTPKWLPGLSYAGNTDEHYWVIGGIGWPAVVRRGFISSVACPAAAWLEHADAIYWRPGQTVECPECRGYGRAYESAGPDSRWVKCCDGTGHVPRPCPPTAQPITTVRLTDNPDRNRPEWKNGVCRGDRPNTVWYDRWPGVTFELPDHEVGPVLQHTERTWTSPRPRPISGS